MIKIPGDEEAQLRLTGLIKTVLFSKATIQNIFNRKFEPLQKDSYHSHFIR